jgi:hypothetical protein
MDVQILAEIGRHYFEFFSGDFVIFGFLGAFAFIFRSKKEDDFYG